MALLLVEVTITAKPAHAFQASFYKTMRRGVLGFLISRRLGPLAAETISAYLRSRAVEKRNIVLSSWTGQRLHDRIII